MTAQCSFAKATPSQLLAHIVAAIKAASNAAAVTAWADALALRTFDAGGYLMADGLPAPITTGPCRIDILTALSQAPPSGSPPTSPPAAWIANVLISGVDALAVKTILEATVIDKATTTTIQATRGTLTVPTNPTVAMVGPVTPRFAWAGVTIPVYAPVTTYVPEYDEWVQPTGAHDAYALGATVSLYGRNWNNLTAANTQKPGVSGWRELMPAGSPPPTWIQPTGAHDVYPLNFLVSYAGTTWKSTIDNNVQVPGTSGAWQDQAPGLPAWTPATTYALNAEVSYQSKTWKNQRANNNQGFAPGVVSSGWMQTPTGSPWYNLGNEGYPLNWEVIHNTHRWRSTANGNFWEPGVALWTDLGVA